MPQASASLLRTGRGKVRKRVWTAKQSPQLDHHQSNTTTWSNVPIPPVGKAKAPERITTTPIVYKTTVSPALSHNVPTKASGSASIGNTFTAVGQSAYMKRLATNVTNILHGLPPELSSPWGSHFHLFYGLENTLWYIPLGAPGCPPVNLPQKRLPSSKSLEVSLVKYLEEIGKRVKPGLAIGKFTVSEVSTVFQQVTAIALYHDQGHTVSLPFR